ncbi:hypothetical protein CBM2587_B90003 [Cupriavidus taiwanensis]|uniref:Uncharacterized protein n=1 Tax=Cupriavidus taiwanensis TaxID=164546 RepID=A0A975XDW4_9BURK|nr:hypothetical protein CBM2587_B90003 [Cupriavidus taiwanensis]
MAMPKHAAGPDLSRAEGALSERLIVLPAERRDHCGYQPGAGEPPDPGRHLQTARQRHDRTDPIEQLPRNPRCHPRAVRGVPRRVLSQGG